jgi:glyoxylase-like metal-dependent hydrolase (beta-lactamase superfamily II)
VEILPGVHRVESDIGGRPLRQYLLRGERVALLDTGLATTPAEVTFPYLDAIGLPPAQIDLVVVTHADGDHHGGNAAVRAAAPDATIVCGEADRQLVESMDALIELRVDAYRPDHGVGYDAATLARVHELVGPDTPVDSTWRGGELVDLGGGWQLRVLALPGHTHGHIGLHDLRHEVAYVGDAVHGSRYPGYDGSIQLPPNYIVLEPYLDTIATLEALDLQGLHGAHWPACEDRAAVAAFLAESRAYVARCDAAVRGALADASGPVGLAQLLPEVNARLDSLPGALELELTLSVAAHLDALVAGGEARSERGPDGLVRFAQAGGQVLPPTA